MSYGKNTLGAVGKEDGYLTYNAKNTFFKKSFKTHTYFGSNWITIGNNHKPSSSSSAASFATTKFPSKSNILFEFTSNSASAIRWRGTGVGTSRVEYLHFRSFSGRTSSTSYINNFGTILTGKTR